ncbi:MAG: hypothetical protein QOE05_2238 [Actinomycetota bacterium]|jgi:hypothetical protein|nr:hypothetical protein [Actinomycetota bacterium]
MAIADPRAHAAGVHNGPSTQTRPSVPCCDGRVQVVALTRDETPGALVELVRCSECGENVWRLDGVDVPKDRALAALSAAFTSTVPRAPRPVRVRPQPPVATPAPALPPHADTAALLAGWQVFGTSR